MSETTAVSPAEIIAAALADHPGGVTAAELATATEADVRDVEALLTALTASGAATHTPGSRNGRRRTPDRWTPIAAPDPTSEEPAVADTNPAPEAAPADPTEPAADGEHATDEATDADATEAESTDADATESPAGPDMRVMIVAQMLGASPNGLTPGQIAGSGLKNSMVARILNAMEAAGAAVRTPRDGEPDLWWLGAADWQTVIVVDGPVMCECDCGHRHRRASGPGTSPTRSRSTAPGQNGDGQPALRPGQLQERVLDFINANPDLELTAGIIARELGRSSGAVGNAVGRLIATGEIRAVDPDAKRVTALAAEPATAE